MAVMLRHPHTHTSQGATPYRLRGPLSRRVSGCRRRIAVELQSGCQNRGGYRVSKRGGGNCELLEYGTCAIMMPIYSIIHVVLFQLPKVL